MKVAITLIVFIGVVIFSFFSFALRLREVSCNVQFEDSLDTIAAQSQTVLSDWSSACTRSYGVLTDWDMCLMQAEQKSPRQILPWIRPVVNTYMMFFREKKKDMSVLKREHDDRCKDYTGLMFYPPEDE